MTHNQRYNIYIASDESDGGIYHYILGDKPEFVEKISLERVQYGLIYDDKVHLLLRDKGDNGSLVSFDVDSNGMLKKQTPPVSTKGKVACHICCDKGNIYVTNYISGSIVKIPEKIIIHTGKSTHTIRQAVPHPHFVCLTPDDKYIAVADLGIDAVVVYDKELNFVSKAEVPKGQGARHIAFSKCGKTAFVANELGSTVSVFDYCDGCFTLRETISTLFESGLRNFPAAIKFYNYLYVSNRGDDSISCFSYENKKLTLKSVTKVRGKCPRDFEVFGNIMVCANHKSDNVTLFSVNGEKLKYKGEISVPSPVCVIGCEVK